MNAVDLIAAERERQVSQEGWTPAHDDEHTFGEIARAAACYAMPPELRQTYRAGFNPRYIASDWPWEASAWKPTSDRIRELVKAGALIAAEIDRLQRGGGK